MRIVIADVVGMCFGVRDALHALDDLVQPRGVTIHGELVHNEKVLDRLRQRGFQMVDEHQRHELPVTSTVLITAHGVSTRERQRLQQAGKHIVDTTCPLVHRAHLGAQKLQADGFHVLLIGKRGHVEVQGIIEDLESFDILESSTDVISYPHTRLGIMCQTTTPTAHAKEIWAVVARKNPQAEIRFVDTICQPTKDHQSALEKMLGEVQAVVVVGGKNSNNTKQLVARCQDKGLPSFHVQSAEDLRAEWFVGLDTVGLTAGTSTLDETVLEVREKLEEFGERGA